MTVGSGHGSVSRGASLDDSIDLLFRHHSSHQLVNMIHSSNSSSNLNTNIGNSNNGNNTYGELS